jgi:heme/copper-type cytochrome/quinol oxidase subunit 2
LTAAGSVYRADSRREKQEKPYEGIPRLKIMIANVVIIILILLFIVVSR